MIECPAIGTRVICNDVEFPPQWSGKPYWSGVVIGHISGTIIKVRPDEPALRVIARAYRESDVNDWFQTSYKDFDPDPGIEPGLFDEVT